MSLGRILGRGPTEQRPRPARIVHTAHYCPGVAAHAHSGSRPTGTAVTRPACGPTVATRHAWPLLAWRCLTRGSGGLAAWRGSGSAVSCATEGGGGEPWGGSTTRIVRRPEAHRHGVRWRCGTGSTLRRRRNGGDLHTGKAWHERRWEERSVTVGGAVTYRRRARHGRDGGDGDFGQSCRNGGEAVEASDRVVGTTVRRARPRTGVSGRARMRRGWCRVAWRRLPTWAYYTHPRCDRGVPPRSANRSTLPRDTDDDTWAPSVSNFPN
jgi:hypothetical protein